jgi:carboxylesterase
MVNVTELPMGKSFLAGETPEAIQRYRVALESGEPARLNLALELAAADYHHPACEAAGSKEKQRSFCWSHQTVTAKSILLIHGFTACPFEMRELGETLYRQGYNVFGVRLAGHGTSESDFAASSRIDWLNSVRRGLAITALFGRETVVIGESMGGALAVLLAQKYPTAIAKLILCAPCFRFKDLRVEFTVFRLVQRLIPRQDMGVSPGELAAYWYRFIPATAVAQLVMIAREARRAGSEITAPALLIQADNDQMVQPRGAQNFFHSLSRLTADRKRLIRFANGHHNLTIDLNPRKDEVFQWMAKFIG